MVLVLEQELPFSLKGGVHLIRQQKMAVVDQSCQCVQ
jgi:hypothetical protein